MKKICFFMSTPFDLGGEQRISSVLANYLANNDCQVTFLLTSKNHTINRKIYNLDARVKIIFISEFSSRAYRIKKKILNFFSKLNSFSGCFKHSYIIQKLFYCTNDETKILKKYFSQMEFDYIIGVGSMFAAKLCIIKKQLPELEKIVFWQNSSCRAYYETKGNRFYNQPKIISKILKNIDIYVVQTESDKEYLKEKYNYTSLKINNPNTFNEYVEKMTFPKRFIAAGRLVKLKNFELLIDSFKRFNNIYPDWKLYIFGDGPEKNKLKAKIKKYKLEDKIFLPGKSLDMKKEYNNASIYLMSSLWEGWGMVVTEAMQNGLAIISTELPSVEEIFGDFNCGIITKPNDVDFAQSMIDLVRENKLKKYSDNCVECVKRFDINKIGAQWLKILGGNKK